MKKLIKKILKEDFEWVSKVTEKDAISNIGVWQQLAYEVYTGNEYTEDEYIDVDNHVKLNDGEIHRRKSILMEYLKREGFNDVFYDGNRVILEVGGWLDTTWLFERCNSEYNYICKDLAERVFSDDYEDLYGFVDGDFESIWGNLNEDSVNGLIEFIKSEHTNDTFEYRGSEYTVNDETINDMLDNPEELGDMIYMCDIFEDIRGSIYGTYSYSYNSVAWDEIQSETTNAVEGLLGEAQWLPNGNEGDLLLTFDITDIFEDFIDSWFEGYCEFDYDDMYDVEKICDFESINFLDNMSYALREEIYEKELNPRHSPYPDSDEVSLMMNTHIGDYL